MANRYYTVHASGPVPPDSTGEWNMQFTHGATDLPFSAGDEADLVQAIYDFATGLNYITTVTMKRYDEVETDVTPT